MLTFDEDAHQYRYDGVVKPSVTQVLSKLHDFSLVPKDVLAAACERGTAVHLLCQYHDEGDLDQSSVGEYRGYLDAWIKFCADYAANWTGIEARGDSKRYGFAGTYDRRGMFGAIPGLWIVDLKTAKQAHPVWGMQLSAYRAMVAETDPNYALARRASVQLKLDGTYKFIEWCDPEDWTAFLSLIQISNWSAKHGG